MTFARYLIKKIVYPLKYLYGIVNMFFVPVSNFLISTPTATSTTEVNKVPSRYENFLHLKYYLSCASSNNNV